MKSFLLFLALLGACVGVCLGQSEVNPAQIRWPLITGAGTPASFYIGCGSSNYGQPYQNTAVTPNALYTCGTDGWVVRSGLPFSGGTLTGPLNAPKIEKVVYVDQYCTTAGTLDQSCFANALAANTAETLFYVPSGTYMFNSQVNITTPAHIRCSPGAVLKDDDNNSTGFVPLNFTGHAADNSSIESCTLATVHQFQACSAATIIAGGCTSNWITVTRYAGDSVGYQPTSTDGDVWPYMTTAQQNNFDYGFHIAFTDVNNVKITGLRGGKANVTVFYTMHGVASGGVTATDNVLNCGGNVGISGCITVSGYGAFTNAAGDVITGVKIYGNDLEHNGPSGAVMFANTDGADIHDNQISYNGEVNIKAYQSFATYGNVRYDIHDNWLAYTAGGCVDLSSNYPDTGTPQPSHWGKFNHNTCLDNGIPSQNGGGPFIGGSYIEVIGNILMNNGCNDLILEGDYVNASENYIYGTALNTGSCTGNSLVNIQQSNYGSNMTLHHNTVVVYPASSSYAIFWNGVQVPLTLTDNHAYGGQIYFGSNVPTISTGNSDSTGLLPNIGKSFVASGTGHAGGFVPDPGATAGTARYLREDATWSTIGNAATATALAATPVQCSTGSFGTGITAAGNMNCSGVVVTTFNSRSGSISLTSTDVDSVGALTNATSGNAATATALAALPTNCSSLGSSYVATGIAANGNATCIVSPPRTYTLNSVTGSRAFGTTYQNTRGYPIFVTGWGTVATGSSLDTNLAVYIGASSASTQIYGNTNTGTIAGEQTGFSFQVPVNWYYQITCANSATCNVGGWFENTY